MKQIGKRAWIVLILCFLFIAGMLFFIVTYFMEAPSWATYPVNAHLYNNGKLMGSGDILDRNGQILATTKDGTRVYSDDYSTRMATLHLVGDTSGNIKTSLEASYTDRLVGWNYIQGTYSYSSSTNGNNITSTVDANLCATAYNLLDGRKGTVGVMNYQTGEILCMVSNPTFDPSSPPTIDTNSDNYNGIYLNRLLSAAYIPGSIFKLVTAAAAIDNLSVDSMQLQCDGSKDFKGGTVTCLNGTAHGTQTFEQALVNSCNVAFAEISIKLGKSTLEDYAEIAGVGEGIKIDRISTARGSFSLKGAADVEIGWAGCGQYTDQINPMTYLNYVATIANNGEPTSPRIIESIKTSFGVPVWFNIDAFKQGEGLDSSTATKLKQMMRDNVTQSYGEGELAGYELCAKSGTAEVGGNNAPHSLFTGFLNDSNYPYAFIVVVENGGTGSVAAASIAKYVLAQAVNSH